MQKDFKYIKPTVDILIDSGIGHAEVAARIAYDSFDKSEHESIRNIKNKKLLQWHEREDINDIKESKLLEDLSFIYHHESVLEHITFSFLINDISRGVLQELARHRIASYTVRSTRYTLGTVLNTFIASQITSDKLKFFIDRMIALDYLVIEGEKYQEIEWKAVYEKLLLQQEMLGHEFIKMILSKNGIEIYNRYHEGFPMQLLRKLESTKQKRNIGDNFKHIVTENWKTSLVMTMNLRSFKNFYKLRSSNAAWFQIRWLANEMFEKLPIKYKLLIDKKLRNEYEN